MLPYTSRTKSVHLSHSSVLVPRIVYIKCAARCLVVDDSPLNRKFLCRLLHGYVNIIDTAQNGNEACEKILEKLEAGEPYDVVCMDSIMPVSFRNSIFYYICCTYPTELVVRVYSA